MEKILTKLFKKSIELGDVKYTEKQIKDNWIGSSPTNLLEIKKVEKKLKIMLPDDYKEMLLVSNGFLTSSKVEPSFIPVEKIDFYKNWKFNVLKAWKEIDGLEEIVNQLERSILIAGIKEEQQFLIIPPINNLDKWKYWKFAMWMTGEEEFDNLKDYFNTVINFLNKEIGK